MLLSLVSFPKLRKGREMNKDILIHLTHGPDKPTEADRAFLIAQIAVEEGYGVAMFLAGASVELLTLPSLDKPLGFGPPLRERFGRILSGQSEIHVSQVSCETRRVDIAQFHEATILSPPRTLLRLLMDYGRVITYG